RRQQGAHRSCQPSSKYVRARAYTQVAAPRPAAYGWAKGGYDMHRSKPLVASSATKMRSKQRRRVSLGLLLLSSLALVISPSARAQDNGGYEQCVAFVEPQLQYWISALASERENYEWMISSRADFAANGYST